MTAKLIDGVEIAQRVRADWKPHVERLRADGVTPGLAVVMVGENPASKAYVRNKVRACRELGIHSEEHLFPILAPGQRANGLLVFRMVPPRTRAFTIDLAVTHASGEASRLGAAYRRAKS